LEDIKEHEWFRGTVTSLEDLIYIMTLRQKGVQASKMLAYESSQNCIFNGIEIPNDGDVNFINKKRVCKGLQIKKYSEYFRFITGDILLSAIISFAESKGLSYQTDSKSDTVLLETVNDDVRVSFKANILKNPSSEQRCIECIKLSGEKTPFMQVFRQL
jgi:hypothetical protein